MLTRWRCTNCEKVFTYPPENNCPNCGEQASIEEIEVKDDPESDEG